MSIGFYSAGALCLLYYAGILAYTKNRRANFSGFWLAAGILNLLAGAGVDSLPEWGSTAVSIFVSAVFLLFFAVEMIIVSGMLGMTKKNLSAVIVPGACIRGSRITDSLKKRLDKALAYLNENPETVVIVSGGKGRGEDISEASAMRLYLLQSGVEEERITVEEKSRSTRENMENSVRCLKDREAPVGIVTNNFHMYRALKLAKESGIRHAEPVTASADPVLFFNYMVREFFAVLFMYIKTGRKNREEQIDKS